MNPAITTGAAVLALATLLALAHVPLGTWIHRVFADDEDWRVERLVYRVVGVDPRTEQRWTGYAVSAVAFAVVSVVFLFLLLVGQGLLPWSLGRSVDWHTAVNTAVSFVTNTNWQSYAGEAGTGYTVQAVGLTVQNFLSAAMGLAVAVALIRGLARHSTDRIGNFWVDLVRGTMRILLPLAVVAAIVLLVGGVIQNLTDPHDDHHHHRWVSRSCRAARSPRRRRSRSSAPTVVASSTPTPRTPSRTRTRGPTCSRSSCCWSSRSRCPYAYGLMVGNRRQGVVATATMATLLVTSMGLAAWAEYAAAGGQLGSMEGKEQRFGLAWSSIFASATTGTSTGAVNSMHDSFSALGGAVPLSNMMLGEVSPGGVGTGLYNLLVYVVLAVFIAGLMVGRTPELLGKTVGRREITYVALSVVVTPALVLIGTGLAIVLPAATAGLLNSGPHGLTEMMYAFTSASNNNGSAFAGLDRRPAVPQPRPGVLHALRPAHSDRPGHRSGRRVRRPAQAPRHRGHHADRHPAVHRPARRHRRGRSPGSPSSRPWHSGRSRRPCHDCCSPDPYRLGRPAPGVRQARPPAHVPLAGHLRGVGGLGAHHRARRAGPVGVHDLGHRVAVGHGALRQPRRGRRRGPRQGPGRDTAQDPHRDHRPTAARGRHRGAGARHRAAPGRPRRRRGRPGHPRRRRRRRGRRDRRRVGDHRRVRPRHPRVRWRPVRRHRRHHRALGPDRRQGHEQAR